MRLPVLLAPENPVLSREMRVRMRGARAPWLLFAYVGTLSLILFVVYFSWARNQADSVTGGMGTASFSIGRTFYEVLFVIQALLVTLITPALTAGGVSIEKEQRTYEMLSVSLLPRRNIVLGKLAAAVAFVGLLLTASLPLVSLCFLLGGVSPGEVGAAYVSLLVTAFVYGAAGIAWSSGARDTTAATLLSYATVGLLFFGSLPLAVPYLPGFYGSSGALGLTSLNPVGAVLYGTRPESYFGQTVPGWGPAVSVNLLLGAILTAASLHRLEYPATGRAWLVRLLTLALCAALVALFCGGLHAPYSASGIRGAVAAGSSGLTAAARRTFVCWLVAFLPCLLAPIFATGAGLSADAARRRWRAGDPVSGLAFVMVATAVCGAILPACGYGVGLRAFAMMVPFVAFGLGGIGLLCSAALRSRWAALQVTLGLSLALFVLPYSVATSRRGGDDGKASARVALIYLSPHPAALEAGDPQRSTPTVPPNPPVAPLTGAIYFGFGIVTVPLAFLVERSRARRRPAGAHPD